MRNISLVGRFRALVGSTSKAMKALNPMPLSDAAKTADGSANPKIIDKFKQEMALIRTYLETTHMKLSRAIEQINHSEGKLQQAVNENAKHVKQTEDSKLWQGLDSEVSSSKTRWTQPDQLTETLQPLAQQEKLVKEKAPVKIDTQMTHKKLRRATELNLSEGKLQQIVNGNAKPKAKQTENSKLWQGLDPEASLTKTLCDQLTKTAGEKEKGSIAMLQHIEVTENKFRRLDSETEISASNISWVGKLPCEKELLQKFLKLESDNQKLQDQEKSKSAEFLQGEISKFHLQVNKLENVINQPCCVLNEKEQLNNCSVERKKTLEDRKLQVAASIPATECQHTEAKKQYDLLLEGKNKELSKHLKELSLKNYQAINEIYDKYELEKIEIANAEKGKAEKLTREMENKYNESISEKEQDSKRYLKEKHGTMVARIQQDKEYNESTLQAYLKEELQRIQSQDENELRERLSLVSKEHELQIKSLMMKHQEECRRMQDELELQNSMDKQSASMQLQKGMGENRQIDKEVNSKKVAGRSLHFPFHQFRMLSSNSTDGKAPGPGNTATIILDLYDIPLSKRSYIRAMNKVVKWCKANTKVFDLSEFFGPGAEVFTTPAEGIFHLKFLCRDRELIFFIKARNLYSVGWEGGKHGAFKIQEHGDEDDEKESERCLQIPGCKVIKMGVNYRTLTKHALGNVRIGLPAMIDAFESLYKCDGKSYNDAMEAVAIFAVNTSEAIRDEEVFKEVQDSFDLFLDRLDSRWDEKSGKAPLSSNIRTYSFYSRQYLKYVDYMMRKEDLPKIENRGDQNVKSIDELRNRIRVPSRDAYSEGKFHNEDRPESVVWYPPYPDDKGWISEEEEE